MKLQVITSILASFAVSTALVANAETISAVEAEAIASRFMPAATAASGSKGGIELRKTVKTATGENGVYLFDVNNGNGFVIVAGDDNVANPVLGYGDEFTTDEIPPQMQYMLDQYAAEVAAAGQMGQASTCGTQLRNSGLPTSVAPLLGGNLWGQTSPFNGMTPEINGKHTVTGCVATSTAQVMRYWSYPATGKGSYNYRWNGLDYINAKFYEGNYDWDNMPMSYVNATQEQKDEVAKLMYHVGVSVNMKYGLSESSAYGPTVVYAVTDNFKYDLGTRIIQRPYFTNAHWEQILRQELAAGRPIIYTGTSQTGGHQFVCDGYNEEGYFHINWGWNGGCNGYFRLTALVPDGVDVAGYLAGYNNNQTAIIGMQPDKGHSIDYGYMVIGQAFSTTNAIDFNLYLAGYTCHAGAVNLDFGFMVADENAPVVDANRITTAKNFTVTPSVALRASGSIYQKKFCNETINCDVVKSQNLTDGDYYLFPVFRPTGSEASDWQIVPVKKSPSIHISVKDGKATVIDQPATTLELDSFEAPKTAIVGQKAKFNATFTALDGEFNGLISLNIYNAAGTVAATAGNHLAAFVAGETQTFTLVAQIPENLPLGTYSAELKAAGAVQGDRIYFEVKSGAVDLDSENFPEYGILAAAMAYDLDGDNRLSDAELAKVTRLNLASQGLESTAGLENFYNLQVLNISDNHISSIDLSAFPSLLSLQADNNNLMSLNVAETPELVVLKVANNHIDELNVNTLTKLKTLDITNNPIAGINLEAADALTTFNSDSKIFVSTASNPTIDLEDLPGVDPAMVSNLRGAHLTGNYLTLEGNEAKYDYNTGDAHYTLPVTIASIDAIGNTSGISSTEADAAAPFAINGLAISFNGAATLFAANGATVATGINAIEAPAAGLYILSINGQAYKVILR